MTPSIRCRSRSCRLCSSQGNEMITGVITRDSLGEWWIVGESHRHGPQGALTYPERVAISRGQSLELLHCDGWREGVVDRDGTDIYFKVEGDYSKVGGDAYERIPLEALVRTGRTVRVVG